MTLHPNHLNYLIYEENFVFFLSMYCKLELHLGVIGRVIPGKARQACAILYSVHVGYESGSATVPVYLAYETIP